MKEWTLTVIVVLSLLAQKLTAAATIGNILEHPRRHKGTSKYHSFYDSLPLKPSLVMIPLDIDESPNKDMDPDTNSVNGHKLLDIMGEDFDDKYMSIHEPEEARLHPNGTLFYKYQKNQTPAIESMPPDIQALEQRSILLSSDGLELNIKFDKKTKKKIQRFLWSYSYCPVRYKWKKLSIRFWPQWIKVGSCDSQRSCSIPAGMTCQPSKMTNIKLLRYYCPIIGSRRTCQWIKIEYPILSQCSCSCHKMSEAGL